MLLIAHLYNFRVVGTKIVSGLCEQFASTLRELDAELLLLLLEHSGFQMRADDPEALRNVILTVQHRIAPTPSTSAAGTAADVPPSSSRHRFILERILDLRNNRLRAKDEERRAVLEPLRKLARSESHGCVRSAPLGRLSVSTVAVRSAAAHAAPAPRGVCVGCR